MASASNPVAGSSSSRHRPPPRTLEPETAHQRHQRIYRLKQAYEHGRNAPAKPTKSEMDVLKERHQFVRDSNVDPSTLSWEDQLALKYYSSLFREFALVNLKHYKTGQIALRWRTESEVLSAIGQLTCGNLRCAHHEPSPSVLARLENSSPPPHDQLEGEAEPPLVDARLEETEMQFGYVEEGEKKSALVKVVLCRECGKRLRYGREKAREERERAKEGVVVRRGEGRAGEEEREREERRGERRRREVEREGDEEEKRRRRRRSEVDEGRRLSRGDDDDDFGPSLPPDLVEDRHHRRSIADSPPSSSSRSRRRSASPERRRSSHR
ncbi:hypothetical protein JCM6882_000918 [Rhodosporidiobolus microsporus]